MGFQRLVEELEATKAILDPLKRRLRVLAVITEALEPDSIRPILVGGCAVEFYTFGGYSTGDVDVVVSDRKRLGEILAKLGFDREGRFWYREDLEIALECPDEDLAGSRDRIVEVEVGDLSCWVIGIEDLLTDRLNGYVHWQWEDDRRWVKEMMQQHCADIDWAYLRIRAREERTLSALEDIERELQDEAS